MLIFVNFSQTKYIHFFNYETSQAQYQQIYAFRNYINNMQQIKQENTRPKVEVYSIVQRGHLIPILKTIQILQKQKPNLDISFVTGPYVKNKFQNLYPKINMIEVDDQLDQNTLKAKSKMTHLQLLDDVFNYMQKYFSNKTNKPDLIIADMFMCQAFIYAKSKQIKFIANHPTSFYGMSDIYNTLNLKRSVRVQGYTIFTPIPDHPFMNKFDKIFDSLRYNGVLIFDSFVGLQDPVMLPSNYNLVGLLPNTVVLHQSIESQLSDWMNGWRKKGNNKFIYISFGSMLSLTEQLTKKLIVIIQKLQYPTIWSLRSPYALKIQSEFIYHKQWLPQQLILKQEDVKCFVTHGGWGSTSESIASSTPMLCIPIFADQIANAQLISKRKIGISILDFYNNQIPQFLDFPIQIQKIIDAIREVMENPCYSQSVKRLSRLSKTHNTAQIIGTIVERLLEFGYEYLIDMTYQNATIKDNSVPLKNILVQKYWSQIQKKQ